ncbi:hypothetical protein [Azospirillum doebereinerae]|uniref:Uncharacterized protein n=1 Tax=Azospirillum doebereinerae TaxID=92933 RepID=A0A3S0WXT2_9PROT|nr:hypothetical protein [Azospirillum doebereinerae]MCG5238244.1 hypothetical protein [Azospirillum doebereinerae]RUQ68169.1 hypothetical protein EJ913_18890 [Azospirillum doebereinerae]
MFDPSAIRRAIDEVERAVVVAPSGTAPNGDAALGKLYTVYAQTVLSAHGITVDLDELCCQSCRACPSGHSCFRDRGRY